jgi:hypothetical protein
LWVVGSCLWRWRDEMGECWAFACTMASLITELTRVVDFDGDVVVLRDLGILREANLLDLGLVWRKELGLFVAVVVCAAVFGVVAAPVAVVAELTSFLLWFTKFASTLILGAGFVVVTILGCVACSIAVVAVFLAAAGMASELQIASITTTVTSAAASTSA